MSRAPDPIDWIVRRDNLREELIQVAAVAVAIVQDLDYGTTDPDLMYRGSRNKTQLSVVIDDIAHERYLQEEKWGPQHHDPLTWLAILAEEVGEAAREVEITPDDTVPGALVAWHLRRAEERARRYLENKFA